MAEILSQSEIDALLRAIQQEDVDINQMKKDEKERPVKVYDFKRPNKFAKEQTRTLQMLHDTFARLLSNNLSGKLRSLCKIEVVSVDQLTFDEYIRSISNPSIVSLFSLSPLEGTAVLEINPMIAFPLLDRLLGGPGKVGKIRELTDIEEGLMRGVLVDAYNFLRESWAAIISLNPKMEKIESNPQFVQIASPSSMVVLISFEATIGENNGVMTLCLPYLTLEPVLHKLSAQHFFTSSKKKLSRESQEALEKRLKVHQLPVSVHLGETAILLRDLLTMDAGDVLRLDRAAADLLPVYLGDRLKFHGKPGKSGKFVAVQLTSKATLAEEVS